MLTKEQPNRNFIESVVLLLMLLGIIFAVYDVVKAFFGVFVFALIFAVSFAKPYEIIVKKLNGKRKLTATLYVVLLLSICTVPFIYVVMSIAHHLKDLLHFVNGVKNNGLPSLPVWISGFPVVGDNISDLYFQLQKNPQQTITPYESQIKNALQHLLKSGTGMLGATSQFILGIIVSGFLLVSGHRILLPLKASMKHLLGARQGLALINASEQAIKGVTIGVMGAALIASVICWIGFTIAGIPFALGLAALVFFLVLIQVGPLPVWIPLIIWYSTLGHTGYTIFLVVYAIGMMILEAFLKPYLISKSGGSLPFLVLFIGVVGGMMAWGFTGMFKGAIVMAVFYTILVTWLEKKKLDNSQSKVIPENL